MSAGEQFRVSRCIFSWADGRGAGDRSEKQNKRGRGNVRSIVRDQQLRNFCFNARWTKISEKMVILDDFWRKRNEKEKCKINCLKCLTSFVIGDVCLWFFCFNFKNFIFFVNKNSKNSGNAFREKKNHFRLRQRVKECVQEAAQHNKNREIRTMSQSQKLWGVCLCVRER